MSLPGLLPAASLSLLLGLAPAAHALPLSPQYAGAYLNGDGANSRWVQVTDDWRGTLQGDEPWGTGIWGLADQADVMTLTSGDPYVVQTLATAVEQIDFADQRFIDEWGTTWGSPQLAPIFDSHAGEPQDNWASSFWGYIAVTTPGAYNFGILYDDGFRFSLIGAGGSAQSILADGLNPRDRLGFSEDLLLSPGLYGFRLDAYERLEAGVVQLAWQTPETGDWVVVPKSHLFANPVPEPSAPMLLLAGLVALGLARRRGAR